MLTTLEMIFACLLCGTERQFGCAENFFHRPDNLKPEIVCGKCRRVTVHQFIKVKPRKEEQERHFEENRRVETNDSKLSRRRA